MIEDSLTELRPINEEHKPGIWRRVWSRIFGGKVEHRPILPGDSIENKSNASIVGEITPLSDESDTGRGITPTMEETREDVLQKLTGIADGNEALCLAATVEHLSKRLERVVSKKHRSNVRDELKLLCLDIMDERDRDAALALLEEKLDETLPNRGEQIFMRSAEVYQDLVRIEALISKLRSKNGKERVPAEAVLHSITVLEQEDDTSSAFLGKEIQEERRIPVKIEHPIEHWPFRFLENDDLPNCRMRERDSVRLVLKSDQLGWLPVDAPISLDTFSLEHLTSSKIEDVNIGMMLIPEIQELFKHALERERYDEEEKSGLGTLETLFYVDVLELISKGRSKKMLRPNVGKGINMYNATNGGPGERRVYYVDLGTVNGNRTLVLVGACVKQEQKELFRYIIR